MEQYGEPPATAKELVDMALAGHYLFNDRVFAAVWRIYKRDGRRGRSLMYELPCVAAYPEGEAIAEWERQLLALDERLKAERAEEQRRQDRSPTLFDQID